MRGIKLAWFHDYSEPAAARIYDYLLNGKDNFAADRRTAHRLSGAFPGARSLALANRRFLIRAVRYLAEHGIGQYVDLGSGLPTPSPNVHEAARQLRPGARVVYIDHDPQVAAHGRAVCGTAEGLAFLEYDLRDYHGILAYLDATRLIDFSAPVGILGVSVLHFITEEDDPHEIVAAFRSRMAPGSYLVLSHATTDGSDAAVLSEAVSAYTESGVSAVPRTAAGIAAFFTGLDLTEPGLVDVARWRPDEPAESPGPPEIRLLGGVGRMP